MKNRPLLFILTIFLFSQQAKAILTPLVDSIPMSDGRKLAADIYIPTGMLNGPVILIQTPYNRLLLHFGLPLGTGLNLNASNYIFVVVDWRGFYGSAAAAYAGAPAIGKDGKDVVEWIAAQTWNNGKVGTWGPSALGRVQFQTEKENPPHLTCICPLVAGPQYEYEEYFPGGDLRTEYVEQLNALGFGVSSVVITHPFHDVVWTFAEAANFYPDSIRVPCFMIGGWYDHTIEEMLPFFNAIRTSSPIGVRDEHRLLMGPWSHGGSGTAYVGSANQGELSYPNAAQWNDSLALLFFDYHLRNIANNWNQTPFVQYFQMGDDTWQSSTTWPLSGTVNTNFYFHHSGLLDIAVPTNSTDQLFFQYDPLNPSPTVGGPTLRTDLDQGPYNQADSVESRNDILIFTTNTLTQNVVMKGNAIVHMNVSSNRKDTDFDIRLTDVYPDGRSIIVNDGVLRMRFRDGFTTADTAALIPGQIYNISITLPNTAITFLAGHKIRVDVTSSNYPRFNRNMNTDGIMYPGNSMDSLITPVIASNTVYTNNTNSSYISLPLVGFSAIADLSSESEIYLYPNPANYEITLERIPLQSKIFLQDINGRIIYSAENKDMTSIQFDTSFLPSGIYLIEIYSANGVTHKKVIVN